MEDVAEPGKMFVVRFVGCLRHVMLYDGVMQGSMRIPVDV